MEPLLLLFLTILRAASAIPAQPKGNSENTALMDCSVFDTNRKGYLPHLITVSKLGDSGKGSVSVNVRCQAYSLRRPGPLDGDYRDLRTTLELEHSAASFSGEGFAEHFSMNCGGRCFAGNVSDVDLMIGKVCEDMKPGKLRCHRSSLKVVMGGTSSALSGSAMIAPPAAASDAGKKALYCVIGLALGLGIGLSLVYIFRMKLAALLGFDEALSRTTPSTQLERAKLEKDENTAGEETLINGVVASSQEAKESLKELSDN